MAAKKTVRKAPDPHEQVIASSAFHQWRPSSAEMEKELVSMRRRKTKK